VKFSLSLANLPQAIKKIEGLADVVQRPAIQEGLLAAAEQIRDAAIAEAPVDDGSLRRGIKAGLLPGGKGAYAASTAPHGHLVEFGTVERHHKSGKSVGVMPANPFFERAVNRTRSAAKDIIISKVKQGGLG
jgi:HK97 gp10 family phage protein